VQISCHACCPHSQQPSLIRQPAHSTTAPQPHHHAACTTSEDAQKIEDGQLVIELKKASPKQLAQERQEQRTAALNQCPGDEIAQLASWQQAQAVVQQHGPDLNYLNVGMLCYKLSLPQAGSAASGIASSTSTSSRGQEPQQQDKQQFDQLASELRWRASA
jgi:hypothetical protein